MKWSWARWSEYVLSLGPAPNSLFDRLRVHSQSLSEVSTQIQIFIYGIAGVKWFNLTTKLHSRF